MNTEQRITYSVGFKAVIALVNAGEVEFETGDIVAETIELADAFYEALAVRQGLDEDAPKASRKSAKKRSGSSGKRDSSRGSSTEKKKSSGPKDPNADASPAQIKFLKKLCRENDVDYDDEGFDLDGNEYFFDEFTMGSIQEPIESLKE